MFHAVRAKWFHVRLSTAVQKGRKSDVGGDSSETLKKPLDRLLLGRLTTDTKWRLTAERVNLSHRFGAADRGFSFDSRDPRKRTTGNRREERDTGFLLQIRPPSHAVAHSRISSSKGGRARVLLPSAREYSIARQTWRLVISTRRLPGMCSSCYLRELTGL